MKFYSIAKRFVKFISYIFFPVKVMGDFDQLPENDGVVLCANHLSYMDAVVLGLAFDRQIRFVAKKRYAQMPVLRSVMKWLGAFGIDPEKPDVAALKRCFSVVKNNEILGIFPEGTRIINGKLSNPMPGAVMIAHKTKKPIFYVKIKPSKEKFKLFFKTLVYIGGVVDVSELGVTNGKGDEYKTASELLMKKIYGLGE